MFSFKNVTYDMAEHQLKSVTKNLILSNYD